MGKSKQTETIWFKNGTALQFESVTEIKNIGKHSIKYVSKSTGKVREAKFNPDEIIGIANDVEDYEERPYRGFIPKNPDDIKSLSMARTKIMKVDDYQELYDNYMALKHDFAEIVYNKYPLKGEKK